MANLSGVQYNNGNLHISAIYCILNTMVCDISKEEVRMKEKQWKRLSVQSVMLLICVLMFGFFYSEDFLDGSGRTALADDIPDKIVSEDLTDLDGEGDVPLEAMAETPIHANKSTLKKRSRTYIKVAKGKIATCAAIYIGDDYINKSVSLTLDEISEKDFSADNIIRYNKGKTISGEAAKKNEFDFVKGISVSSLKLKSGNYRVIINIKTKKLYEPCLYEIKGEYYISFAEPHKLYDKIVVIDAGHGGIDEGASSIDKKYHEKDYTLFIVQEIKKLMDKSDIKAYYTRLDDRYVSKPDRTKLANNLKADLFISIHCNASDRGDTTAYGVETLYSARQTKRFSITNKKLARLLMNNVAEKVDNRKRGIIKREGLYLLHHSDVPTSIVEVGYMTNKSDLKCIRGKSNRKKMADGIYKAIDKALYTVD